MDTLPNPEEEVDIPSPELPPMDAETEELWSSRALLLVLFLLILSFWTSYTLKVRRLRTVHETIVALFMGMIVGFILRISPGTWLQTMVSFKHTIMMNVLLPPIILSSGYDLKQRHFFGSFGVILGFAFVGTFISAVVIGLVVFLWSQLGFEGLQPGIIECLIFGSSLSATDPVTVLAIFNALKVEPKLYTVIFGESLLNDAVAIVMFETLKHVHTMVPSLYSLFHGVGLFLLVFFISMFLGALFGLGCSLMLKHSRLGEWPDIETSLVFLIAYTSYFFSNAVNFSGIVSLLFCGITLKHYAYHNMSHRTKRTIKYIFHTLSQLSENFIFIYLGLTLFTQTDLVYKPFFIAVTAIAVVMARYCAVFPLSKFINWVFRKKDEALGVSVSHHHTTSTTLPYANEHFAPEIPHSHQMMLFWAGLRGAVDVALAAGIEGPHAKSLRTTVLVNVVLSMAVFGGTTMRMIEFVGVRTGVVDEDESSDDEEEDRYFQEGGYGVVDDRDRSPYKEDNAYEGATPKGNTSRQHLDPAAAESRKSLPRSNSDLSLNSMDSSDEVLPQGGNVDPMAANAVWRDGQWFTVLDERFLLPMFSNATASRRQALRKSMRRSTTNFDHFDADGSGSGAASPISLNGPWSESRSPNGRRTFSPAAWEQIGGHGMRGNGRRGKEGGSEKISAMGMNGIETLDSKQNDLMKATMKPATKIARSKEDISNFRDHSQTSSLATSTISLLSPRHSHYSQSLANLPEDVLKTPTHRQAALVLSPTTIASTSLETKKES